MTTTRNEGGVEARFAEKSCGLWPHDHLLVVPIIPEPLDRLSTLLPSDGGAELALSLVEFVAASNTIKRSMPGDEDSSEGGMERDEESSEE
jgi:hypothetical protein